jgi:DNA-binding transcriptional MocR family regulator
VSFQKPSAGMFLWLKLLNSSVSSDDVFKYLADVGVVTVSGDAFKVPLNVSQSHASDTDSQRCLRLSFANASPKNMTEAVSRMSKYFSGK